MSQNHRVQKIRNSLVLNHWTVIPLHRLQQNPAIRKGRAADSGANVDVYLVVKRRPLAELSWRHRWMIRISYFRSGWASDYSVEYQGVYTDEAAARHAASGPGMSYTKLPLNESLPDETCQYGVHDFPISDASVLYRRRNLPFVAIPRSDLESLTHLGAKIDQLHDCIDGKCVKVT